MALLLSASLAALVPSVLLHLAGRRERARAAWSRLVLRSAACAHPPEHRYGPAKPCWREGFYEQRCTVDGCPVSRHRRLGHVPAEPVPAGEERVGFTTRG